MKSKDDVFIDPEKLAYWYLRLNGFFTITNFVVHPDRGNKQETDADIIGIRFPYRRENLEIPMEDDHRFTKYRNQTLILIAEVKTTLCKLNGPWTEATKNNMVRVLNAIGALNDNGNYLASKELYEKGFYDNDFYHISLICIGGHYNEEYKISYPDVNQILWKNVLNFIHDRLTIYRNQKRSHDQWDEDGKNLFNAVVNDYRNKEDFFSHVKDKKTSKNLVYSLI